MSTTSTTEWLNLLSSGMCLSEITKECVPQVSGTTEDSVLQVPGPQTENHSTAMVQQIKPFTLVDCSHFHLKDGVVVTASLLDRLHKLQDPRKVIKETVQAIWGNDNLAGRTFGGRLAPKDRKAAGIPRKGLTPQKVDVIAATVRFWEGLHRDFIAERKMDVTGALAKMSKVLAEKIQDVREAARGI